MYSPSDEPRLYPEARAVLEALRWVSRQIRHSAWEQYPPLVFSVCGRSAQG